MGFFLPCASVPAWLFAPIYRCKYKHASSAARIYAADVEQHSARNWHFTHPYSALALARPCFSVGTQPRKGLEGHTRQNHRVHTRSSHRCRCPARRAFSTSCNTSEYPLGAGVWTSARSKASCTPSECESTRVTKAAEHAACWCCHERPLWLTPEMPHPWVICAVKAPRRCVEPVETPRWAVLVEVLLLPLLGMSMLQGSSRVSGMSTTPKQVSSGPRHVRPKSRSSAGFLPPKRRLSRELEIARIGAEVGMRKNCRR